MSLQDNIPVTSKKRKSITKNKLEQAKFSTMRQRYEREIDAIKKQICDYENLDHEKVASFNKDVPNEMDLIPKKYRLNKQRPSESWKTLHSSSQYTRRDFIGLFYDVGHKKIGASVIWQKSPQHPCVVLFSDNINLSDKVFTHSELENRYDIPALDDQYNKWSDDIDNTNYHHIIQREKDLYAALLDRLHIGMMLYLGEKEHVFKDSNEYKSFSNNDEYENIFNSTAIFGCDKIPKSISKCVLMTCFTLFGTDVKDNGSDESQERLAEIIESIDKNPSIETLPKKPLASQKKKEKQIFYKNLQTLNEYLKSRFGNVDIVGIEKQASVFGSSATEGESSFHQSASLVFTSPTTEIDVIDGGLKMHLHQLDDNHFNILNKLDEKKRNKYLKQLMAVGPSGGFIRTLNNHSEIEELLSLNTFSPDLIKPKK